jgi:hypothetical protein|tara:strand:+ start:6122 stop:6565 length:444 start_codon:yes stop_codon:yes gene_type:complete
MSDRNPRTNDTRATAERPKTWKRAGTLPTPESRDGIKYRWIRTSTLGNSDNTNVSSKFREGWTPVKAEDHPELQVLPDIDSRFQGNVEVGGLLLCENSAEYIESRSQAHREMNKNQIDSVDNNFMRNSDSRMPVLPPERSTKTTFGK